MLSKAASFDRFRTSGTSNSRGAYPAIASDRGTKS